MLAIARRQFPSKKLIILFFLKSGFFTENEEGEISSDEEGNAVAKVAAKRKDEQDTSADIEMDLMEAKIEGEMAEEEVQVVAAVEDKDTEVGEIKAFLCCYGAVCIAHFQKCYEVVAVQ